MSLLIILYLLLVIVLPLGLSAVVSYRTLPDGKDCPLCGNDTLRLRTRLLRWASAVKPGTVLQRRWCLDCGWEGVTRVSRPVRDMPASEAAQTAEATDAAKPTAADGASVADVAQAADAEETEETEERTTQRPSAGRAIDLRRLEVDGRRWRVLLETWCDTDGWYGRLLFSAPSGRLWADRSDVFHGPSPLDVLGQALSLPDRVLTCRLRDVLSST